jgi:1-phosphatidylinositol phosphodiesterase
MGGTKHLSVLNLTHESIVVHLEHPKVPTTQLIASHRIAAVTEFPPVSQLQLSLQCYRKDSDTESVATLKLKRHISRKRRWKFIPCPERCWRIYHYEVNVNHQRILILPERNLASWMKDLPDCLPLSSLCLPGNGLLRDMRIAAANRIQQGRMRRWHYMAGLFPNVGELISTRQ